MQMLGSSSVQHVQNKMILINKAFALKLEGLVSPHSTQFEKQLDALTHPFTCKLITHTHDR